MSPESPAPPLARLLFFSVVLLFPLLDLAMAWLYHLTHTPSVNLLRYYRDFACVALAVMGFCDPALPARLRVFAALYLLLLACYSCISVAMAELPLPLILASLGTLMIPLTLPLAAFAVIRTPADMARLLTFLSFYAVASTLFGLWEIGHTDFWSGTVGLGAYIAEVKGTTTGFQPDTMLPWNFIGFEAERRAAGLLAAPLAQGFFLTVVGLTGFAYLRGRSVWLAAALLTLCAYGTFASATRGAMLALVIGTVGYFLYPVADAATRRTNQLLVMLLTLCALPVVLHHALYTVTLADHSTIGHVRALVENLQQIDGVVLLGSGVGAAGAETASAGLEIEGGGEGAFFSLAYQIGLPGAFCFLLYFLQWLKPLWHMRAAPATGGELARALLFLSIGVGLSMGTSEHILTFSGMAAYWFLLGGYGGYITRREAP